jgi:anti-anti-sigma factor
MLRSAITDGNRVQFVIREESGVDGTRVLAVSGELDLDTAGELRRRLLATDGGRSRTVVDLAECAFIDSTGIGLLVRAAKRAQEERGPRLVIVAPPGGQVRRTLRLCNVDTRVPVADSLGEALFGQDGASRNSSTE